MSARLSLTLGAERSEQVSAQAHRQENVEKLNSPVAILQLVAFLAWPAVELCDAFLALQRDQLVDEQNARACARNLGIGADGIDHEAETTGVRCPGNGGNDTATRRQRIEFDRSGRRGGTPEPRPEGLHRRIGKIRVNLVRMKAEDSLREKCGEDSVGARQRVIGDQFDRAEQFGEPRFLHPQLPARVAGQFRCEKLSAVGLQPRRKDDVRLGGWGRSASGLQNPRHSKG